METILIIAIAVVIGLALGAPPNAFHPVAWMGKIISLLEKGGKKLNPTAQFFYGIAMTLLTLVLFIVPILFLFLYLEEINLIVRIVVAAFLLKSTFSIRGLRG